MQGAGNPQQRGEVSPWNEDESTFCSKPFILLAKLSHTRFKPVFYRWVFPHFLIGAPVRQEGLNKDLISLDDQPFWRRNWFRVEAQDHLARSVSNITLSAKLDKFLLEKVRRHPPESMSPCIMSLIRSYNDVGCRSQALPSLLSYHASSFSRVTTFQCSVCLVSLL